MRFVHFLVLALGVATGLSGPAVAAGIELSPVLGAAWTNDQKLTAIIGGIVDYDSETGPWTAGFRGVAQPGIAAGSVSVGPVLLRRMGHGAGSLFKLDLSFRAERSWLAASNPGRNFYGYEIGIDFTVFRAAIGRLRDASSGDWQTTFAVGLVYW